MEVPVEVVVSSLVAGQVVVRMGALELERPSSQVEVAVVVDQEVQELIKEGAYREEVVVEENAIFLEEVYLAAC